MVTQLLSLFTYVLTQPLLLRLSIAAAVLATFGAIVLSAKALSNPLRFITSAGAGVSRRSARFEAPRIQAITKR